jgi:hypothetical protein
LGTKRRCLPQTLLLDDHAPSDNFQVRRSSNAAAIIARCRYVRQSGEHVHLGQKCGLSTAEPSLIADRSSAGNRRSISTIFLSIQNFDSYSSVPVW